MHQATTLTREFPDKTVSLMGRRIDLMTVSSIVNSICSSKNSGQKMIVAHYNVHGFNMSMQLPWFETFLRNADIVHCDGMGIIKALNFFNIDVSHQYRVSYSLLMPQLLDSCNSKRMRVFLLGSKPAYLNKAIENLKSQYPNAIFDGHHGYFSIHDYESNGSVIEKINDFCPDILIVGMGMPLQEEWVYLNHDSINAGATLVGGAVIDRLAGIVDHCPAILSDLGWEWLYRLMREPRRLASRYLLGNPAFFLNVIFAKYLNLKEFEFNNPVKVNGLSDRLISGLAYLGENSRDELEQSSRLMRGNNAYYPRKRLGEYIVEAGLLTPKHIDQALKAQNRTGQPLGEILVAEGLLRKETVEFVVKHMSAATQSNSSSISLKKVTLNSSS